jgi:large repetitive protein
MTRIFTLVVVLAAAGCSDSGGSAPAAPSNLIVAPLGAGAHLTWDDNSADETEFVIMRQEIDLDDAMIEIASVPFDGVQFHDEPVTSGATYVYQVIATNEAGDAESNQVSFDAP